MNKKESAFTHWIFTEYSSLNKGLPIFRVIYVAFIFLVVLPRFLWIASYPDTFFFPRIGVTLFFSGFPGIIFFYVLVFLLIVALLALLVGYKPFYSSLAVAFLLFVGSAWSYSFGKINHDLFFILIPLIMSVSCWGEGIGKYRKIPKEYSWPIPIFALLISLAMLTAAMAKLTSGWLNPSVSALAGHLVHNYFMRDRHTLVSTYLLSSNNFYIFKFLDYATLVIETAFIFSIFSLRTFRLVCAFAIFFHLGVQLNMEISFTPNVLAYALFVNWGYLYRFERSRGWLESLQNIFSKVGILRIVGIAIPVWFVYVYWGNPFAFSLGLSSIIGGSIVEILIMITAAIISLIYIYQYLRSLIKSKPEKAVESAPE